MRIPITNDDGITAPGLAVAEEIAAKLTGPDGEVQDPRAVLVAHVPGAGSLAANTVKSSGL